MASQQENLVANLIGSHAYGNMVHSLCIGLCYGISASLFFASLHVLSQHKERPTKSRKFLLALICFMFLMDTGLLISNVGNNLELFQWARDTITDNIPPLENRLLASNVAALPYYICSLLFEIVNFIIGDAIVIWRATVLWPHSYWIQGGLCFLFLGDVGVGLYDLVTFSTAEVHTAGQSTPSISIDTARILVSMVVNLLATLCIGVKAWQFRGDLQLAFSKSAPKKSLVNQVLKLFIESGVIFCALQLIYAIYDLVIFPRADNSALMSPISLVATSLSTVFPMMAGMYPSLIVLIMAEQDSVFGNVAYSENNPAAHKAGQQQSNALSALQFASALESIDQASSQYQSVSTSENLKQYSNDGVVFSTDAAKAV